MKHKTNRFHEGQSVKVIAAYSSFFGDCGYVWDSWIDNQGTRRYTVIVGKFTIYMLHSELTAS